MKPQEIAPIADQVRDVLEKAMVHADDCDDVLIVLQKRKGGLIYLARDNARVETLIFLLNSLQHRLLSLLAE